MSRNSNIYLLGFMGVGKSTVGKLLAEKLDRQFFDIDDLIVESAGKPIAKIFEEDGDEHFRQFESYMLKNVAEEKNAVISCGGGIVMKNENMKIIHETGTGVFLSAAIDTLIERIGEATERPLLNGLSDKEPLRRLLPRGRVLLLRSRREDPSLDRGLPVRAHPAPGAPGPLARHRLLHR